MSGRSYNFDLSQDRARQLVRKLQAAADYGDAHAAGVLLDLHHKGALAELGYTEKPKRTRKAS